MKCPKCGEELPLLSKVCPACGLVVDKEDGAPGAMELTEELDAEVIEIKKLVHEANTLKLRSSIWLYILVAGFFLGALAVKSSIGLFWILALAAVIVAFVVFRRTREVSVSSLLAGHKIAYEYGTSLVKRYFRGNTEMARFMDENAHVVEEAEARISAGRSRSRLVGWILAAVELVLCVLLLVAIPTKGQRAAKAETQVPKEYDAQVAWYIKEGQPQQAIEAYAASEFNDDFAGAPKRQALTEALCQAGYTAEAAQYVLLYCVGKPQDLECAKAVVQAYLAVSDNAAAADFVAKCTGLRYKSDLNKLKALI